MRLAAAIFVLGFAPAATAQDLGKFIPDDSYVRAFGGASRAVDGDVDDKGPLAGFAFGIDRGALRSELEVARRSNSDDDMDRTVDTAAINIYHDFGESRLTPYVGAGVGLSKADVSNRDGSASDTGLLTGQAMIGVDYQLGGAASLNGEIRYLRTETPEFRDDAIEAFDAVVGVTLRF